MEVLLFFYFLNFESLIFMYPLPGFPYLFHCLFCVGLPGVLWVLPDSYIDVKNKDYGGSKKQKHLLSTPVGIQECSVC